MSFYCRTILLNICRYVLRTTNNVLLQINNIEYQQNMGETKKMKAENQNKMEQNRPIIFVHYLNVKKLLPITPLLHQHTN